MAETTGRKTKQRHDGSGSVFQRKSDQRWVAQIRVMDPLTGKSRQVRRYASTRDAARALLEELRQQPSPTPARASKSQKVADYLEDWTLTRLPHTGLADSSKEIYGQLLRWYAIPAAGSITLARFTPANAEHWLSEVRATRMHVGAKYDTDGRPLREAGRHGDPIAEATVRKTYNATLKALDTAVRDGLIGSNPLRSIDRPKQPKVPVPVATSDHTDAAIEATRHMRIGPLVVVVAYTGMRLGEALGLKWSDVDLDAATVTVRRSAATTERTKTGKVRTITLLPEAVDALRQVKKRQAEDRLKVGAGWHATDLVFTTATGHPMDGHNCRRDLQAALRREGLEPARPWHAFRHGLATRLLAKGVPMPVVSAILGHSGIQITVDTYGHLDAVIPAGVLSTALDHPQLEGSGVSASRTERRRSGLAPLGRHTCANPALTPDSPQLA